MSNNNKKYFNVCRTKPFISCETIIIHATHITTINWNRHLGKLYLQHNAINKISNCYPSLMKNLERRTNEANTNNQDEWKINLTISIHWSHFSLHNSNCIYTTLALSMGIEIIVLSIQCNINLWFIELIRHHISDIFSKNIKLIRINLASTLKIILSSELKHNTILLVHILVIENSFTLFILIHFMSHFLLFRVTGLLQSTSHKCSQYWKVLF